MVIRSVRYDHSWTWHSPACGVTNAACEWVWALNNLTLLPWGKSLITGARKSRRCIMESLAHPQIEKKAGGRHKDYSHWPLTDPLSDLILIWYFFPTPLVSMAVLLLSFPWCVHSPSLPLHSSFGGCPVISRSPYYVHRQPCLEYCCRGLSLCHGLAMLSLPYIGRLSYGSPSGIPVPGLFITRQG